MAQEAPQTAPKRPDRPRRSRPQQASKRLHDGSKTAGGGPEVFQSYTREAKVIELEALPVRPGEVFRPSLHQDSAPYAWQGGANRPSVHRGSALVACTSEPDSGTPLLCSAPTPVPGRIQRSARRVEEARKTPLHFAGIPKLNCRRSHFQRRRSSRIALSFLIGSLRCEFFGRG